MYFLLRLKRLSCITAHLIYTVYEYESVTISNIFLAVDKIFKVKGLVVLGAIVKSVFWKIADENEAPVGTRTCVSPVLSGLMAITISLTNLQPVFN